MVLRVSGPCGRRVLRGRRSSPGLDRAEMRRSVFPYGSDLRRVFPQLGGRLCGDAEMRRWFPGLRAEVLTGGGGAGVTGQVGAVPAVGAGGAGPRCGLGGEPVTRPAWTGSRSGRHAAVTPVRLTSRRPDSGGSPTPLNHLLVWCGRVTNDAVDQPGTASPRRPVTRARRSAPPSPASESGEAGPICSSTPRGPPATVVPCPCHEPGSVLAAARMVTPEPHAPGAGVDGPPDVTPGRPVVLSLWSCQATSAARGATVRGDRRADGGPAQAAIGR